MRNPSLLITVAALFAAAGGASAAPPMPRAFDAALARDPATRLVLCDTAIFLASKPEFNANRILARRDGRPFERLLPPYFVQSGAIYSESMERLLFKLRRQGVTRRAVADTQAGVGRRMIDAYRRGALRRPELRAQVAYCRGWARGQGVYVSF